MHVHMDGQRLFHLNSLQFENSIKCADSITLVFYKGFGANSGAILAGN